jgi:hypothetical protein
MSELLPDDDLLGEDNARDVGNPALRIFGRTLLVSAGATFGLGLLVGTVEGGVAADVLIPLLMFAIIGIPVGCFVAAVVYSIRGERAHALGFLLAGLVTPIIGFGSCLASFILLS